jgi:hypothetical protein
MSKFIIELVGVDVFIDILVVTPGSLERKYKRSLPIQTMGQSICQPALPLVI